MMWLERFRNLWKRLLGLHVCYYVTDRSSANGIEGVYLRCKYCGKRMNED